MRARTVTVARSLASLTALIALASCGDPGGPIGMTWDEIHTVCGANTAIRGIDVSVYQGTIDWPAASRGGVRFAYMRLANNLTLDTTFVRNWTNSRAAGVMRGAYQYFNPHSDAVAQANFVADTLMRNGFAVGDLPPMIDVEYPQSATNPLPARAAYATAVRRWLDTIRTRLGVEGVIYTGGYYWDANLNTNEFAAVSYWHAQYPNYYGPGDARNRIYQYNVTPLPLGGCPTSVSNHWTRWTFWQFAGDNGRAPGVSGPVDCDAFNGTMDDLRRLARLPPLDAGVADAGRDASASDSGARDSGRDGATVSDAGVRVDAGPSADSATVIDAGASEVDAGASDVDAAVVAMDAEAPADSAVTDAGRADGARVDGGSAGEMRGGCGCRVDVGGSGPAGRSSAALALVVFAMALGARRRVNAG
jgi:lysozyme